jgi:hypothetical protein
MSDCKGCSEYKDSQYLMKCGHSLCNNCAYSINRCIECDSYNDKSPLCVNMSYNNIIVRIKYINQIMNDIETIDKLIKERKENNII